MATSEERLATLEAEVKHVNDALKKQDDVLEAQSTDIKKLLSMADKSSGALFALMTISGIIGAILSHVLDLIKLLTGKG